MKCKHTKILKWKAVKNYGAIVNAGSEFKVEEKNEKVIKLSNVTEICQQ